MVDTMNLEDAIKKAPYNWDKWGENDEIGTLNYLTKDVILKAKNAIRTGKIFTLGLMIGSDKGDLVSPGRITTIHLSTQDEGTYNVGKKSPLIGGLKFADDMVVMYLQGSTHVDALGHAWYGDKLYNGYDAKTTIGGLSKGSIASLASKSISGRAVLLDVAAYKKKEFLEPGTQITLQDLLETARFEKIEIEKRDIILIRTGSLKRYYQVGSSEYFKVFNEPGITYSYEIVKWFNDMEIVSYGADTLGSEQTISSATGTRSPLHIFLLRNLGIPLQELLWLEELAEDCSQDGQYDFFYVCTPLKFLGGTGSPVNPVVIK